MLGCSRVTAAVAGPESSRRNQGLHVGSPPCRDGRPAGADRAAGEHTLMHTHTNTHTHVTHKHPHTQGAMLLLTHSHVFMFTHTYENTHMHSTLAPLDVGTHACV